MSAPSPVPGERLRVRWLGRMPYEEAWDLQRAFREGRVDGRSRDDYLLLVEHPPTYTIGRNGDGSNLRVDEAGKDQLAAGINHLANAGLNPWGDLDNLFPIDQNIGFKALLSSHQCA